MYFYFLLRNW